MLHQTQGETNTPSPDWSLHASRSAAGRPHPGFGVATRAELGRLLLRQQGLLGERQLRGPGGAVTWVNDQGFMPLELRAHALAPSHDIALFERVNGYRTGSLEMALYDHEEVIEHYLYVPGALPARDFRLIYDPERAAEASQPGSLGAMLLAYLRGEGAATVKELQAHLRTLGQDDRKAIGRALHDLHASGCILIKRREAGVELYDLAERVLPGCTRKPLPLEERLCALARRALRVLAPVTRQSWNRVLNALGSQSRLGVTAMKREKGRLLSEMLEEEKATEVVMEDSVESYILPADWLASLHARPSGAAPRVSFLAPLDPVIWDRQRAQSLFGYDWHRRGYRRAADRRQFSPHALAILYGEQIVGRLQPQVSWSQQRMVVDGLELEKESLQEQALFRAAFAQALRELATFHEVTDVWAGNGVPRELLP